MPGLFVTATGTEVGKTFVAAGLLRAGRRAGRAMGALKPVLSGFDPAEAASSDAGVLLAALGRPLDEVAAMSPWRFAAPLSPDMAAALEGRAVDVAAVIAACRAAAAGDALTLIEGVGGVMVPLDERSTVLDVMAAVGLPVLLVTASALGAVSHCLTAIAALASRGLAPALVVLNESAAGTVPLDLTVRTLRCHCPTPVAVLPRGAADRHFDALLAQAAPHAGPSRTAGTAA